MSRVPLASSLIGGLALASLAPTLPWAHLDSAGMAWREDASAVSPKGATAFGIRLLDQFARDNHT